MSEMPPPSPEQQPQQPSSSSRQRRATPGVPRPGELLDRFLARLIDGIILGVAFFILSTIFNGIFVSGLTTSVAEYVVYALFTYIIWTALVIGYFAFMETSRGQSLGKMALKLRTIGPDGGNPTMEQSVRRNSFYAIQLISIIPVLGWVLGPILSLVAVIMIAVGINNDTVNRQGWHDRFAGGTKVLKVG